MSFYVNGDFIHSSHVSDLTGREAPKNISQGQILSAKGRFWRIDGISKTGDVFLRPDLGRVYLAGPMRGYPLHNFPAFLTAAAYLQSLGFDVVNPAAHDLAHGFDMRRTVEEQKFDIHRALGWDFQQIIECSGIVLLDGWEKSVGAKAERLVASMTGKFVLRLTADLKLMDDAGWTSSLEWVQTGSA